jgi:hypothetical protein
MKKTILLFIILCSIENAYSQDIQLAYDKKVLEVDSLKKANNSLRADIANLQRKIKENDSIYKQKELSNHSLQKEIADLEKYKTEKKAIEQKLSLKSDTISNLKNEITKKDINYKTADEKYRKDVMIEKENGKKEILLQVANTYKNNKFDDLIISSSSTSLGFDKQLLAADTLAQKIISHLEIYFNAEKLLSLKFNEVQVNKAISQLNLLKVQSDLVNTLIKKLDKLEALNEGLKETLQKIVEFDVTEKVGTSTQPVIIQSKHYKISSKISKYILVNDLNFQDYPYLSNIILEVIKRKQTDLDTDVSDLLAKIE